MVQNNLVNSWLQISSEISFRLSEE